VLARRLTELLPGSLAIGEEGVSADRATLDLLAGERPVWIIDPVDGTNNFANSVPCFAVIVCLVQRGQTLAGWIHDPLANSTVYGERGAGAWEDGQRLTVRPAGPLAAMTGSLKRSVRRQLADRLAQGESGLPTIVKRYRCVGREYMDLARGQLDFVAYGGTLKPWDHAAGVLIYGEAGGHAAMTATGAGYQLIPPSASGDILLAPTPALWTAVGALYG